MAVALTIEEAAELEGVDYFALYRRIERGKINSVKIKSNSHSSGYEIRIELEELSEKAQRKYYAKLSGDTITERKLTMEVSDLTEKQRKDAYEWQHIIEEWEKHVSGNWKKKTALTEEFVQKWNQEHDKKISVRTLNRKREQYRENGIVGLADFRGTNASKRGSQIPEVVWALFLNWWLDEAKPNVSTVYRNVSYFVEMNLPELYEQLPTYATFYNNTKKLPVAVVKFFREGNKAFEDDCIPFLRRMYNDIDSNDVWSADYHTLDILVKDDVTGKLIRPHASVWIDVRSRKILSVVLCENSNSDGVISAFKKAAVKYGLPKQVYLDNGREYLVSDFGGRGRRKTDENAEYGLTILERCGVKMYNAQVRNGKSKVIERIFAEVKKEFSKLVTTYTGGHPDERPERMKKLNKVLEKEDNVPLLSEIKIFFENYVEGIYNEKESSGMGMNGKCPNDVYEENLIRKRTATKEELNIMLMRTARLQKVTRNGVMLKFGSTILDYWDEELLEHYEGQKVFVRYDIDDLSEVRVDDEQGRFIGTAKFKNNGGYAFGTVMNIDAVKELNHQKKLRRNSVKKFMDDTLETIENLREMGIEVPDNMLSMQDMIAKHNIEAKGSKRKYEADILEPIEFKIPEPEDEEAVEIDLEKMVRNAMNS